MPEAGKAIFQQGFEKWPKPDLRSTTMIGPSDNVNGDQVTQHLLVRTASTQTAGCTLHNNAMPDESDSSGSVLYPQEIYLKRSSDIGFGSWLWTSRSAPLGGKKSAALPGSR